MYDPIDPEFRPFVDGRVLNDLPRSLFLQGRFQRVPLIIGTVRDEFGTPFGVELLVRLCCTIDESVKTDALIYV